MALSGSAALAMFVDVAPEAADEHDRWHTQEHFPERLSIPGFLRGSRWIAADAGPRLFILYEVADVGVLTGEAYRARLDHPTPWTRRIMQTYRGMTRGFCAVRASFGAGLGNALLAVRYTAAPGREASLRAWLAETATSLCGQPGYASAHLLSPAVPPPMTNEQAIRGRDAQMPELLLVSGYRMEAVAQAVTSEGMRAQGASDCVAHAYRFDHSLTAREVQEGRHASRADPAAPV